MKARVAIHTFMFLSLVILTSGTLVATDGIVLINQARALAGGLTSGDTPGFPVTISLSGSYRLSGNLTVPNENTVAIEVKAEDVSIDLNGFMISGPTRCTGIVTHCNPTGTGVGIWAMTSDNLSISNGTIRGMGGTGISSGGYSASVSNVRVMENGGSGIAVSEGLITGNFVVRNGQTGILFWGSVTVTGNVVVANGEQGIWDGGNLARGVVSGNTITYSALFGLRLSPYTSYYGNTLDQNNDGGAQVNGGVNLGNNLCRNALCP